MAEKGTVQDLSKGALLMLVCGSIGWLFITVNSHDSNITSLNDRSDVVVSLKNEINKLEETVTELEKSVASAKTTINQIEPQWKNLGLLRGTLSRTRETLSSMGAKVDRNTSDVKGLTIIRSSCKGIP